MILLLMMIRDEDYEWLFDEMSKRMFSQKIDFFKEYTSDDEQFSLENLELRNQIYIVTASEAHKFEVFVAGALNV